MKSWWSNDTDRNISAKSLTLLIFVVGVDIVWLTKSRTRVSAVTFSVIIIIIIIKNEYHSNIIVDRLQGCSHSKKLRESETH